MTASTSVQTETSGQPGKVISVVTVVRNAAAVIEPTMLSVLAQTYPHIEYIVVDGASTDDTFEIVKRHADDLDLIVSEPDTGIYDAMNKAARMATGSFIIYMNAGDRFLNDRAVEDFVRFMVGGAGIYYSGWVVEYDWGHTKSSLPKPLTHLRRGMIVQHQSMLVSADYMRAHPFDLSHGNGADYALLAEAAVAGEKLKQVPGYLSIVSAGGVSDTHRIPTLRSHWRTARLLFPGLTTDLYFIGQMASHHARLWVKRLMPLSAIRAIIQRRV